MTQRALLGVYAIVSDINQLREPVCVCVCVIAEAEQAGCPAVGLLGLQQHAHLREENKNEGFIFGGCQHDMSLNHQGNGAKFVARRFSKNKSLGGSGKELNIATNKLS